MTTEIFISYAEADRDFLLKLEQHLSFLKWEGFLQSWHSLKLMPEAVSSTEISKHLESADIILLMISPDFVASEYLYNEEMKYALKRHERKQALVVPVILKPVDWQHSPFGHLEPLPQDGKPVTSWSDSNEAFVDVSQKLRRMIQKDPTLQRNQHTVAVRPDRGALLLTNPQAASQRKEKLKELCALLTQPEVSGLILTGLDGVRKSTLAHLLRQFVERQEDGYFSRTTLWIKINPTMKLVDLAPRLFESLAVDLPDFASFSPELQALTFFEILNNVEKPVLIVLDQFDCWLNQQTGDPEIDQPGVAECLALFNDQPCRSRIVMTSKYFPRNLLPLCLKEYPLGGLDEAAGMDVLRRGILSTMGREEVEGDLREAVQRCQGIPLALNLLIIDLNNRKLSLRSFLQDHRYTRVWEGTVARNLVDSIYRKCLKPSQQKLLEAFAVYREAVTLEAAEAVLRQQQADVDTLQLVSDLDTLLMQHLLQASGEGWYSVPTLICNYARQRLSEAKIGFTLQLAQRGVADYYLQQVKKGPNGNPYDLQDGHNLEEAIWHLCQAQEWERAYALLFEQGFFDWLKVRGENATLLELILPFHVTPAWQPDEIQVITIYNSLGMVYNLLGKKKEALNYYKPALALLEKRGDERNQGVTLRHIGRVYNALGQKRMALTYFEMALALLEKQEAWEEAARAYERLGRVYSVIGQKQQARQVYLLALQMYEESGNEIGQGTTLSYLGRVYSSLDRAEEGLKKCQQGIELLEKTGEMRGKGRALDNLGCIYHALQQEKKALEALEEAWAITKRIGDRGGEGIVLQDSGNVYRSLGLADKAKEMYGRALKILSEVGDEWRVGLAMSSLADLHQSLHEYDLALGYYKQAIRKCREIEDYLTAGTALHHLGLFLLDQGNYEQAIGCFLQADLLLEKGKFPVQEVVRQGIGGLWERLGEEQLVHLLKQVGPHAAEMVDRLLDAM